MEFDLEFEKPLAELEQKRRQLQQKKSVSLDDQREIESLGQEIERRMQECYANLTPWQTVQVARHKDRPYTADYIRLMCQSFFELHGDRAVCDDRAILAGPAQLDERVVMIIGQQKGRDIREKQMHNFGMPHPEGYRKAYRIMQQAEKFRLPLLCFIDTPGAFPGLDDEKHGQSEAIAANLFLMARLQVPIIAVVLGEGGSGGALAISVADRLLMFEHSIYTVAAPEAAASILWRDTSFAPQAAEAMRIVARDLKAGGVIDEIIAEPIGGAHRNHRLTADNLKIALVRHLQELESQDIQNIIGARYQKYRHLGSYTHILNS